MKIPDYKINSDKYCDYHRDNGHNTDECYHLKKLIEKMVKASDLNQYVKDLRDRLGPKEDKGKAPEEGERYRGEVRTIFGGTVLDRSSKTAKKKYARQIHNLYSINSARQPFTIIFSEEDYDDVILPHEDPLVINPVIGQNKIWKVLVDGGSSVNVLYYNTYLKMNLEGKQIDTCYEAPLYGFDNQPVPIEGTIHLPLLLGKSPIYCGKTGRILCGSGGKSVQCHFGETCSCFFSSDCLYSSSQAKVSDRERSGGDEGRSKSRPYHYVGGAGERQGSRWRRRK